MNERRKITDAREARRCLTAARKAGERVGDWARAHGIDGRSLNAWRMNLARRGPVGTPRAARPPAALVVRPRAALVELVQAPRPRAAARYTSNGRHADAGEPLQPGPAPRNQPRSELIAVSTPQVPDDRLGAFFPPRQDLGQGLAAGDGAQLGKSERPGAIGLGWLVHGAHLAARAAPGSRYVGPRSYGAARAGRSVRAFNSTGHCCFARAHGAAVRPVCRREPLAFSDSLAGVPSYERL